MSNYAIYRPKGAAAEYAEWACNFYVGCSNGCTYCYLKKGRGAKVLGGDKPTLKKCFKDEHHALEVFEKELKVNLPELQEKGLFFSFSTDPMLLETIVLTYRAMVVCLEHDVPVKILTKITDFIDLAMFNLSGKDGCSIFDFPDDQKKSIAFGFTLTGHDEIETGASTNQERIEAMKKLHDAGFKTFASIEPIINLVSSYKMIQQTMGFCDLYKVGIESGKKYSRLELDEFISNTIADTNAKIYFKDSLLKTAGIERSELPASCVTRDYNIFKQ